MSRWRTAFRLAFRETTRNRARSALVVLSVAVPVMAGVGGAQLAHVARWEGEQAARAGIGAADGYLLVSRYPKVETQFELGDSISARPLEFTRSGNGAKVAVERSTARVDLAGLIPAGARVIPAPRQAEVVLPSGGTAQVQAFGAADPMAEGIVGLSEGRAARTPSEVAVSEPIAREFSLLDHGSLKRQAEIPVGGRTLRVVGILDDDSAFGHSAGPARLVVSPDSRLVPADPEPGYLLALPDGVDLAALADRLAAHGVAFKPRDVYFHPQAWGAPLSQPGSLDRRSLLLGASVVAGGLVEVVLVVGAVFMVSVRRRIRELGVLASVGAGPRDVRRLVLAQGLIQGAGGALLGVGLGLLGSRLAVPVYEAMSHHTIWSFGIDWPVVAGIAMAGSVTGLIGAAVPAWSIGRISPIEAITGHTADGSAIARIGRRATALVAGGAAAVVAGTIAEHHGSWVIGHTLVAVIDLAGLAALTLGLVLVAPRVVGLGSAAGLALPLAGRIAVRDTARHRVRSAATVVSLMAVVAAALVSTVVLQRVGDDAARTATAPRHSLKFSFAQDPGSQRDPERSARMVTSTLRGVLGPGTTMVAWRVVHGPGGGQDLTLLGGPDGYNDILLIDRATLRFIVGDDATAIDAFDRGDLVIADRRVVPAGPATIALFPRPQDPRHRWRRSVVVAEHARWRGPFGGVWMSRAAAAKMGLASVPVEGLYRADRTVTGADVDTLAVHGINSSSRDIDEARVKRIQNAIGAATLVLALLIAGMALALSASEGAADMATLAAIGAGPRMRRRINLAAGSYLGAVGAALGTALGLAVVASILDGDIRGAVLVKLVAVVAAVPVLAGATGWLLAPTRLTLVRRQE